MQCRGVKAANRSACSAKAVRFYRIQYSALRPHCDNGVYEDVLGFCACCAAGKDKPSEYEWFKVRKVRGTVTAVAPATEADCFESKDSVKVHNAKKEFLRIMMTKGRRDVADMWPEIFFLAWDEFQIRKVIEA